LIEAPSLRQLASTQLLLLTFYVHRNYFGFAVVSLVQISPPPQRNMQMRNISVIFIFNVAESALNLQLWFGHQA